MNNITRRNFALLELCQCMKPSVGLLHYEVAVHCPSEVLGKIDTESLNVETCSISTHQPQLGAERNYRSEEKVSSHGLAFTGV